MIPSQIERDILIEAPAEVVWRAVTEPEQISRWWSDAADFELRAGAEGSLTWNERATGSPAVVRISVETVEPPHTFAFRWVHSDGVEAREGNSLHVEFTLTPEGEHTRLRVVETGFLEIEWPEEQKATYADHHSSGWEAHLANLRDYLVGLPGVASSR